MTKREAMRRTKELFGDDAWCVDQPGQSQSRSARFLVAKGPQLIGWGASWKEALASASENISRLESRKPLDLGHEPIPNREAVMRLAIPSK